MNIYASTACIRGRQPVTERVRDYNEAGLWNVELGFPVTVAPGELESLPNDDSQRLLIHNYFPPPPEEFVLNLASKDDRIRNLSLQLVENAIEWTTRLGGNLYTVHSGFITDAVSMGKSSFVFPMPDSPEETDRAIERFLESLEVIEHMASTAGVRVAIENNVCPEDLRGKLLLQTTEQFVSLFQQIPDSQIGILLDTGHLNVSARTYGFDPASFPAELAHKIYAIHLHQNDGIEDQHRPVDLTTWVIPALRKLDWAELPIVVEAKFDTVQALAEHISWLPEALLAQ